MGSVALGKLLGLAEPPFLHQVWFVSQSGPTGIKHSAHRRGPPMLQLPPSHHPVLQPSPNEPCSLVARNALLCFKDCGLGSKQTPTQITPGQSDPPPAGAAPGQTGKGVGCRESTGTGEELGKSPAWESRGLQLDLAWRSGRRRVML